MNKTIAQKWIKALRSGEYKQGKRALSANGTYCCLGVLCELAAEEKICTVYNNDEHKGYDGVGGSSGDEILPDSVRVWARMNSGLGKVEGEKYDLAYLNDIGFGSSNDNNVKSLSFEEIANIIEDNYKDL